MKFFQCLKENYFNVLVAGLILALLWVAIVTQIKFVFLNSESVPFKVCVHVYNLKPEKESLCALNFKGRTFVKYLVGVAGDEIRYVDDDGSFGKTIYVGDMKIGEVKKAKHLTPISARKIPEGYVFVAGTHPDSLDSRYEEFGLIPVQDIQGKVFGCVQHWPFFKFSTQVPFDVTTKKS